MKVELMCQVCLRGSRIEQQAAFITYVSAPAHDQGIYDVTCARGHHTVNVVRDERFERLMDYGASALIDGYAREAVTSIAASVERFYEFAIELFLDHMGVSAEEFKATWKVVAKQSERQLGAFTFLYLAVTGKRPPALKDDTIKFRNSVIHSGRFPTYNEAADFGDECLALIFSVLLSIQKSHAPTIITLIDRHYQERVKEAAKKSKVVFEGLGGRDTAVRLNLIEKSTFGQHTFRDWLRWQAAYLKLEIPEDDPEATEDGHGSHGEGDSSE